MTIIDLLLVAIVVGGAFMGYRRGIIKQLGAVVGSIGGIILCNALAPTLAENFNAPDDTVETQLMHTVLSYVVIFIAVYVGVRLLSRIFSSLLIATNLGELDNIIGAIYKPLEWTLMLSLFLNLWLMIFPNSEVRSSSEKVTEVVLDLAPTVLGSETAREIFNRADSIGQSLAPAAQPDSIDMVDTVDDYESTETHAITGKSR
jgi:membrane protein required for colicin V production